MVYASITLVWLYLALLAIVVAGERWGPMARLLEVTAKAALPLTTVLILTGIFLWLRGDWESVHQGLFFTHVGAGLLVFIPLAAHLKKHVFEKLGLHLSVGVGIVLVAIGPFLAIYAKDEFVVGQRWTDLGMWRLGATLLLLLMVSGFKRFVFVMVGSALFLALNEALAHIYDDAFSLVVDHLDILLQVWLAIAWYWWWKGRVGRAKVPEDSEPSPRRSWTQRRTAIALGFLLAWSLLPTFGSGFLLAAGAAASEAARIHRVFHEVMGLLLAVIFFSHLGLVSIRRAMARKSLRPVFIPLLAGLLISIAAAAFSLDEAARSDSLYSAEAVFQPSAVYLLPEGQIDQDSLVLSERSCRVAPGCHSTIFEQWEMSAHAQSGISPVFQSLLAHAIKEKGPEVATYCAGCHAPGALFDEDPPAETFPSGRAWRAGVSCGVCHFVREVRMEKDPVEIVLAPPKQLEYAQAEATGQLVRTAAPELHFRRNFPAAIRQPQFCGACHFQVVDAHLNGVGREVLQDQFSSWKEGPFGPDSETVMACQDCHMRRVPDEYSDFDLPVRDHRMLGANFVLPQLHGHEDMSELVREFLRGEVHIPRGEWDPSNPNRRYNPGHMGRGDFIAPPGHQLPKGGVFEVAVQAQKSGDALSVQAQLRGKKVGHQFPVGPQDIGETWTEWVVRSPQGELGRAIQKIGAEELAADGEPIERHEVWKIRKHQERGRIPPGGALALSWELLLPSGADGPFEVEVSLWHRPYRDEMIDGVLRGKGMELPESARKIMLARHQTSVP